MIKYRSDIDVLRAFAVLLVVIYHSPYGQFLPGGYIGVDVFFVISGYLIIPRIVDEIQTGTFSFRQFYSRRFFRLFPTLLALFILVSIGSFFFSHPAIYKDIPRTIYSSLTLSTNEYFRISSFDYFLEETLKENHLLHLWSIAVEEQFYFLIPIFLFLGVKKFKSIKFSILTLTLFSLISSILVMTIDKTAGFYSLPFRLWELLVGGIIGTSLTTIKRFPRIIYIASLSGLVFLAKYYSQKTIFPGMTAVPVVVLTSLVLMTGSFLQAPRFIRYLGKISYSLYLWHWPIFIFAASAPFKILTNHSVSGIWLIFFSFVISSLSYHLIENRFRYFFESKYKTVFILVSLFVALGIARIIPNTSQNSIYPKYETAFPTRANVPYLLYQLDKSSRLEDFVIGNKNVEPEIAFLGDSLTGMLGLGLDAKLLKANLSAYHFSYKSCPMLMGFESKFEDCRLLQARIWQFIINNKSVKKVVLLSQWSNLYSERHSWNSNLSQEAKEKYFQARLEETRDRISKDITLIVPPQNTSHDLLDDYFSYYFKYESHSTVLTPADYQKYLIEKFIHVARKVSGITIYDPNIYLCHEGICPHLIDGTPIFLDVYHFNEIGSHYFAEKFLSDQTQE